jgi:hypothetical protein
MNFRHPEHLDAPRFHHEIGEASAVGVHRPAAGLLALLLALALLALIAVASLAAQGTSLVPLLTIALVAAVLLVLGSLRPR